MPTYDYRCNACGARFEVFQSMTEAKKKKCPKCGKPKLERLIGPGAGFIFKGTGFYQTDYRSDSYREAAKADASESSPAAPSSTTKEAASSDRAPASGGAAPATDKPSAPASPSKKRSGKKD